MFFTVKLIMMMMMMIIIITISEKLQQSTELKDELTRKLQLNAGYIVLLVLSTMGIIPPPTPPKKRNYRII